MDIKQLSFKEFPKRILDAKPAPAKLYIRGKLPNPNLKNLIIVGSRNHTNYGKQVVKDIIAGLVGYPINIVSGLALGIDTLVHEEAIRHGMTTTAFPGSGIDSKSIHPRTNIILVEKIIESGGCIVSEFEPNFKATQYSFPQRNRLMAAYGDAVLVIEAEIKSGTLITARLATEYNRDVLVVPGSIYNSTSRGTNWLLSQGATPITSANDILRALRFDVQEKPQTKDLTDEEKTILEILREPLTRDEIIRECSGTTAEINTLLMKMELRSLIIEEAGYFRII